MTNFLFSLGGFLLALGVLVTFHEFGHFLMARLCGVKVLRFCIGFGKPLYAIRRGKDATEWALAAIPLGGYVKFLDETEGAVASHEIHRAFNRQPLHKKALIVAAGPIFNLFLAVLLYWAMFLYGVDKPKALLAAAPAHTPAAIAGIQAGDLVLRVGNREVRAWDDFAWAITQQGVSERNLELTVRRGTAELTRFLDLTEVAAAADEGRALEAAGLALFRPAVPPVLGAVDAGSAAADAGLLVGDRIIAIDAQAISDWQALAQKISASPAQTIQITVMRGERTVQLTATPRPDSQNAHIGRLGIRNSAQPERRAEHLTTVRTGPIQGLVAAMTRTAEMSAFTLRMMGRLVTGQLSLRHISGPVTIADYAGKSAQVGLPAFLAFLALISISLGVLNLLPIPLLDGGHLLYYLAEFLRGKPLPERILDYGQRLGIGVLVLLMGLAFFNDIYRLVTA